MLSLNLVTFAGEVIGGLLTGSLALLADAGHMLTDISGIAMSLIAMWLSRRPANNEKTFGYHRTEILAALANAVLLLVVAVFVFIEAARRFQHPPEIRAGWMLAVAAIGLVNNMIGVLLLRAGSAGNLNVRGAYLEVLGDALGSVGAIVAGLIVLLGGPELADPVIGVGIGLFIVPRAWSLLRESVDVLLEAAPRDLDIDKMRAALKSLPGVLDVHDVHVWTITSGMHAVSAHITVADNRRSLPVMTEARELLRSEFALDHSTLQVEPVGFEEAVDKLHR